jgi:hypothetical protein
LDDHATTRGATVKGSRQAYSARKTGLVTTLHEILIVVESDRWRSIIAGEDAQHLMKHGCHLTTQYPQSEEDPWSNEMEFFVTLPTYAVVQKTPPHCSKGLLPIVDIVW